MRALKFVIPLGLFLVLVFFLWRGLSLDPREVPSPLIDKPAPAFTLPQLHAVEKTFSPAEMKGQVWLLNVWGSWCSGCRQEHPVLLDVQRSKLVPIYGFNWKDAPDAAKGFLEKLGDPYVLSAADREGRVAIDYGVYGAPETFLIDKQGVIRFKHIGPLTPEVVRDKITPLVQRLQAG